MPLNRYGGYGGYGGGGSYSSYTSSYTPSYGRSGSASPATLRATTPSRAFGSNSIINTILPEDRAYKISSYYSPGTYSRLYSGGEYRDVKTIKTEELDTEERERERHHAIPGEITRDTTLNIRGGKPVVRIVTQKSKENPYINNPGWRSKIKEEEEKNNLTLGQRLALKHQIADKPRPKEKSPLGKTRSEKQKGESGSEDSEWTWETCSSSSQEQDGYEYTTVKKSQALSRLKTPPPSNESAKRPPVVYSRSNTTTLCSTEDSTAIKAAPSCPATPNSAVRNRWLDAMLSDKPKQQTSTERIPNFGAAVSVNKNILDRQLSKESDKTASNRNQSQSRPVSWAGTGPLQDVQGNVHTVSPPSSSGSSSSPPLYKFQPRKGAVPAMIDSSDEDMAEMRPGWRPGQPPRGDVVVKLTKAARKESSSNAAVITRDQSRPETKDKSVNKVLTGGAVISSRVPAGMNDKYNIPGLMIKPSTKEAPKSVEAKLTLSPVEGKISLTTKVNDCKSPGYQSSIYTPSKSPLLESKTPLTTATKKDPSSGVSSVSLKSVVEAGAGDSEESEWEYYTESEEEIQESKLFSSEQAKIQEPDNRTKESVSTKNNVQSSASKSLNIPVPAASLQITGTSKPKIASVKVPTESVPESAPSDAGKLPVKIKTEPSKTSLTQDAPSAKTEPKRELNVIKNKETGKEVNKTASVSNNKVALVPKELKVTHVTHGQAVETKADPQNKTEQKINQIKPASVTQKQNVVVEDKISETKTKETPKEVKTSKDNFINPPAKIISEKPREVTPEKNSKTHTTSAAQQAQEKVKNAANKKQNEDILSGPPQKQQDKQVSKVANRDKITATSAAAPVQTKSAENVSSPPTTDKNDLLSPNTASPSSHPAQQESISRTSSPENGMPATSLERLPSALKNMFAGNISPPRSSPENAPKWYNNTPKDDPTDSNKVIAQLKNDYNKQVKKHQKQEESLIKVSDAPSDPWYEDENDDMGELLTKRPSILKEVDMNQDRRLTPEENSAVIKMYGGIMFPGGPLERTPKNLLFRLRKALGRTDSVDKQKRDSGFESGLVSQRTNSTSSNSSTISSESDALMNILDLAFYDVKLKEYSAGVMDYSSSLTF